MENNQLANNIKSLEAQKIGSTSLRDLIKRNNRLEKEMNLNNNSLIRGLTDTGQNKSARTTAEKVIDLPKKERKG